jgi:hypothetical protein
VHCGRKMYAVHRSGPPLPTGALALSGLSERVPAKPTHARSGRKAIAGHLGVRRRRGGRASSAGAWAAELLPLAGCATQLVKEGPLIRSNFRTLRGLERFLQQPPQGGVPRSAPGPGALGCLGQGKGRSLRRAPFVPICVWRRSRRVQDGLVLAASRVRRWWRCSRTSRQAAARTAQAPGVIAQRQVGRPSPITGGSGVLSFSDAARAAIVR